jgi:hypothetical protein
MEHSKQLAAAAIRWCGSHHSSFDAEHAYKNPNGVHMQFSYGSVFGAANRTRPIIFLCLEARKTVMRRSADELPQPREIKNKFSPILLLQFSISSIEPRSIEPRDEKWHPLLRLA